MHILTYQKVFGLMTPACAVIIILSETVLVI